MSLPFQERQKIVISKIKWSHIIGTFFLLFPSFSQAKTQIIFVPGLNFNVSKFSNIERSLGSDFEYHYFPIDYNVGDVKLWKEKRDNFLKDILAKNERIILVAQSLGALLFYKKAESFYRTIYISPAFNMRFGASFICLLAKIPFWRDLESRNYKEYRLHEVTTRSAYKGLCEMVSDFDEKALEKSQGIIAIDKNDELVDEKKFPRNQSLKIEYFEKSSENKFHHLIVDEFTLKEGEFTRLINKLRSVIAE